MRKDWVFRPVDEDAVLRMTGELQVTPLIARLLIHRGLQSPEAAERFLCADVGALADPKRMAGLPQAVRLIRQAVGSRAKILIVGDYDVDGLTGSAILMRVLSSLGARAACHIPHRMEDGYGLKSEVVEQAHRDGVRLLITVDCGTCSFRELELARRLGMEAIVVDHHDLDAGRHPPASAFLNPLRSDCLYPEKELASAGVAFTLARGLADRTEAVWEHLDLAALGTIADMAPLSGENRILVRAGLHGIEHSRKPGLAALLSGAGVEDQPLTPEEVSFRLAPPLNAAGRLGSAEASFRLLTTDDPAEARMAARELFRSNRARSTLGRESFRRALVKVAREINFSKDRVIVLEDDQWHPGVIGILATRLAARFHRPTVVISVNGSAFCRGSARSTRALDLVQALQAVKEHVVEFGGHPGAAGLTIKREKIASFREALNRVAHERMNAGHLSPSVDLDGELPLAELTEELMRDVEALAPFGLGNPRPVFLSRDGRFPSEKFSAGFDPMGVRLVVESPEGKVFKALQPRDALGQGLDLRRVRGVVHLAYSPVRRRREGGFSIELRLKDLRLP